MASDPTLGRPRVRRRGVGPFSLRQVGLALGVIVVAGVGLTLATAPLGTVGPGIPRPLPTAFLLGSPEPGLAVGDLAPELAVDLPDGGRFELRDLGGRPIRLADLRGRVVWLNFWASWCPPCQFETPVLREMDEAYASRGLTIVAVNVQQTVEDARDYAQRYGWRFLVGADVSAHVFHAYRVFALPTQFFIDADGILRQVVNGPLDRAAAGKIVEALLPSER